MSWNAIQRWWKWVYNTRRPLPWLVYDTSGAPSAVFCVVHPDTREKLTKLSTATYDKAFLDATERHQTKVKRDIAYARKQGWRIPRQLTAEETRNVILQYDVVQQAEKGLVLARQADHVTRGATETWLPASAFQRGNSRIAPFSGYATLKDYVFR